MANIVDFSEWLQSELDQKGWKQSDLSKRSGINSGLLSRIINGERRPGVKNVHPHRLRHSFATDYLRNGGKMIALQELLGHSDLEMVRRYAKFVEADIALDHSVASPADKLKL